ALPDLSPSEVERDSPLVARGPGHTAGERALADLQLHASAKHRLAEAAQSCAGQGQVLDEDGRGAIPEDRGCRRADPLAPEPAAAARPVRTLSETSQIRTPSSPGQSARSSDPLNRALASCSIAGQARLYAAAAGTSY